MCWALVCSTLQIDKLIALYGVSGTTDPPTPSLLRSESDVRTVGKVARQPTEVRSFHVGEPRFLACCCRLLCYYLALGVSAAGRGGCLRQASSMRSEERFVVRVMQRVPWPFFLMKIKCVGTPHVSFSWGKEAGILMMLDYRLLMRERYWFVLHISPGWRGEKKGGRGGGVHEGMVGWMRRVSVVLGTK